MTSHTGSVNGSSPGGLLAPVWNTRPWPPLRMVYASDDLALSAA
jgi:hypothetical protein